MRNVTRKDLVVEVSKATFLTQGIVEEVFVALLNQIKKEYQAGNKIELREFGTFSPYARKEKFYLDLKTFNTKKMPAKTLLKFKCSKQLYY
jgi:nucleoid DNA-binding protein